MWKTRMRTVMIGATAAALLAGGGAMLVAPASASSVTNWAKIWKKQIKPRADKRYVTKADARSTYAKKSSLGGYYTKAQADSVFATNQELQDLVEGDLGDALKDYAKTSDLAPYAKIGDSYTKDESDAKYPLKSDSYTKAESDAKYPLKSDSYTKAQSDSNYYSKSQSDAKYALAQSVQKGTFYVVGDNFTDGRFALFGGSVSFATTLSAAPTVHVLQVGETDAACPNGTADNPTAASGQLCVYVRSTENFNGIQIVNPATPIGTEPGDPGVTSFGFGIRVEGNGTVGHTAAMGSWAVGK